MEEIFILEDDETLGRGIAMALETPECKVTLAQTLKQAQDMLQKQFSLLILDINLPDGSGIDLLCRLRAQGNSVPIILLTANDLELDEVTGLEAGADDYITKPFSLAVLRARVNAQLRRSASMTNECVSIGPFSFDFQRMEFKRNGLAIELSKQNRNFCGYWWKTGDVRFPGKCWWIGYGQTAQTLWKKMLCPSL